MLKLNVEQLARRIRTCGDFRTAGRLVSVQGVLTSTLQAAVGNLCKIMMRDGPILAEVIGFDHGHSLLMPLEFAVEFAPGQAVVGLDRGQSVPVGDRMLGRVINAIGAPIDGRGALAAQAWVAIQRRPPDPLKRDAICEPFVTGQKAIDGLLTIGKGQRVGLFAGSGVGKSTLLGEIAKYAQADVNVVALVGERGREVRPFIERCLGKLGLSRSVVIVSTADESPLHRIRAAQTAITLAAWFRQRGQHVLFLLDSITRLASAQRELGLAIGEPPSARGFPPSTFQLLANLIEQLGNCSQGSITGLLTVLVDGDDVTEPITDAARSILDGHIVLDRAMAEKGLFPAIDVPGSISRTFHDVTDPAHQQDAQKIREMLKTYQEVADLIRIGAYQAGNSPVVDRAVALKPLIDEFIRQPIDSSLPFDQTRATLAQIVN